MTSKACSSHLSLVDQIESFIHDEGGAQPNDESIRRRLGQAGLKLHLAMEAPRDTMFRIGNTPLQLSLAYVGIEKGIFEALSEHDDSLVTNEMLAQKTNINPALMKRLLRYYQSVGMVAQFGDDSYGPNNVTKNLTSPINVTGLKFFFEVAGQAYMAAPQFMRETGYTNASDPASCAWNIAHQTDKSCYEWLGGHPDIGKTVSDFMVVQRDGVPDFLDVLDLDQEFAKETSEWTPLLVDIGGGMGHQCLVFRQKYPNLPGRVILQDQAYVIEQAKSNPLRGFEDSGVEAQAHNFFEPQPIKGARIYYIRNVLHNHTDDSCVRILENIKLSMDQDSVIIIDDMVLSECHVPPRASQLDMCMFTCLAAKERSEREWQALLNEAGLKILRKYRYTDEFQEAILVVIPK